MSTSSIVKLTITALVISAFAGCCLKKQPSTAKEGEVIPVTQVQEVQTPGTGEEGVVAGAPLPTPLSGVQNVFYFDFDKSIVKAHDYDAISAHAQYLVAHPSKKVHIVGHADERGTREYNLALGERRAKAVSEILLAQGAKQEQITITSYGEEAPAALGHNEEAWALNRRAELLY